MSDTPLIVNVAPNGARRTHADHPRLPLTPRELAETAKACVEAGAAMIHLHVRDPDNRHTLDVETYRAAMAAVDRAVGRELIVQVTSEAVGVYQPDQQMAMVRDLRPEAVSLAIREIVPDTDDEPGAADFLGWLSGEGIHPQFILYSPGDIARLQDLMRRGVVPQRRPFVLYVLGRYSVGQRSEPADLLPMLAAAEGCDWPWSVCAFGAKENACALTAAALGGHARVGFENNLLLADGQVAPDNAALVAQVVAGAQLLGREVSDAHRARRVLGMAD